jgi:hypothetical protein
VDYTAGQEQGRSALTHAILLDARQTSTHIVVSFVGTLNQCRAQKRDPGTYGSLPRSEWDARSVEPKSLLDPSGNPLSGEISVLEPIAVVAEQ